eukprot:9274454-Lingulodinium_polyedra.AAC.1
MRRRTRPSVGQRRRWRGRGPGRKDEALLGPSRGSSANGPACEQHQRRRRAGHRRCPGRLGPVQADCGGGVHGGGSTHFPQFALPCDLVLHLADIGCIKSGQTC